MKLTYESVRDEVLRIAKFGIVGVAATIVHTSIALLTLPHLGSPFAANLAGFLCGFVVSFLGQALWTFGITSGHGRALLRFFIVGVSSFLVSNIVLSAVKASGLLPDWASLLIAIAIIPLCTFTAARLWAFKQAS